MTDPRLIFGGILAAVLLGSRAKAADAGDCTSFGSYPCVLRWYDDVDRYRGASSPFTTIDYLSVMAQESFGLPEAKPFKDSGEIGLFQVTPPAFSDLQAAGFVSYAHGDLEFDPLKQIESGMRYLDLVYTWTGNYRDAIKAYNIGIGNVQRGSLFETGEKYFAAVMKHKERLTKMISEGALSKVKK